MFTGKAGAYPSEALCNFSSLGLAPGLAHKHKTRVERLARDELQITKIRNYGEKRFTTLGPGRLMLLRKNALTIGRWTKPIS